MSSFQKIRSTIPSEVKLVAVSKTHPAIRIKELYDQGQRAFGENKVQELTSKINDLPGDIEWHFIGHLQSNKVKYIAPFIHLIHSVDSIKLLKEINKEAGKNNRIISCLIELHVAKEESKSGIRIDQIDSFINEYKVLEFPNIRLSGVMGMATFTQDESIIRNEFKMIHEGFNKTRALLPLTVQGSFKEISMGMSGDYNIAIEEGSTIVRIGSAIFGSR